MASVHLTLRKIDGTSLPLEVTEGVHIAEVKRAIELQHSVATAQIKLIFKGRVLEDDRSLSDYGILRVPAASDAPAGITDGCSLHMVLSKRSSAPTVAPAPAPSATPSVPAAQPTASPAAPFPGVSPYSMPLTGSSAQPHHSAISYATPFGFHGLGGMGLGGGAAEDAPMEAYMQQMQQMLQQNPQMQEAILNSPMMQQMLDNPDTLQAMIHNNPQLRRMAERNPEVSQMLSDPSVLREGLNMMRNPEMFRAVLRNQDLMISNIENNPDGYSALSHAYREVQQPITEAAAMLRRTNTPTSIPSSTATVDSAPIPNPWSSSPSQSPASTLPASSAPRNWGNAPAAAPPSYQNLFSAFNGLSNPYSSPASNPNTTPAAVPPTAASPASAASTAATFAASHNPTPTPFSVPAAAPGGFPFYAPPVAAPANPAGTTGAPPALPPLDPLHLQQVQQLLQNPQYMQTLMNAFYPPPASGAAPAQPVPFYNPYYTPGAVPAAPSPAVSVPPPASAVPLDVLRARYGPQLEDLRSMGFTDEERVLRVLEACQGNIEFAANRLLG